MSHHLDKYQNHKLEVEILQNLLLEAKKKLRDESKKLNNQGWVDWILELIGY